MIAPRRRPREDQIAELTRGQRFPLPPLAPAHLSVIVDTLVEVWAQLRTENGRIFREGSEAELNALMETRLNDLWASNPLWAQLVTAVARGKETLSFDGTHLEKRPDLSIYLTGKHPSFPLVVECKIIDLPSGKGVELYCVNGISRFVTGEYAWANSDAIMIAYIRDNSAIESHLEPHLKHGARLSPDPWNTERFPLDLPTSSPPSSHHRRDFAYVHASSREKPGSIALWHLWFDSVDTNLGK